MIDREFLTAVALYGAMGLQLALSVTVGLVGGGWLDRHFHTSPWLTIAGLLAGAVAGFTTFLHLLNWKSKS